MHRLGIGYLRVYKWQGVKVGKRPMAGSLHTF